MHELDQMIVEQGYQNRSEAIRDFTRAGMQQAAQKMGKSGRCVAALVYVYDHTARDLSRRLVENYHATMISRWRRCTSISMTTIAWK